VIVTGAGDKAFVAGADISQMQDMGPIEARAFAETGAQVAETFETSAKPYIAAVNGFALGGGCELALSCDFIYASEKARFGQPEVALGLIPGFGGTSRLVRRVGVAWAKEIVLSGDPLKADDALRIGLANRVFEPDALIPKALETCGSIAARGPLAVVSAKRVMQQGQDADIRVAHALEQSAFGAIFGSDDSTEGMTAFLEKRDPKFGGR
jgi:enoyl-CoA hydratase